MKKSMGKNPPKRALSIDVLRGLAILGMIVYHIAFVMNFYDIRTIDMTAPNWRILQRTVQFLFIGLVGISMKMSKKTCREQIRRGFFIFGCGMLVTLATLIAVPDYYVRFGVLHLIGTGIIALCFFKNKPRSLVVIAVASIILGQFVSIPPTGPTVDYFSIFPWISVIAIGALMPVPRWKVETNPISASLGFLGRKSLIIYLVHVPVIIGILMMFWDMRIT